ncbi:hypothetical protein GCM10011371_28380 [Novosphingobium marinum]|nr:hypothetical protein GCM10011371_28380 [Novosphingobium marinum]
MRAEAFWQFRGHSGRAAWIARLVFVVRRMRECTASATSEPEGGPIGSAVASGGHVTAAQGPQGFGRYIRRGAGPSKVRPKLHFR